MIYVYGHHGNIIDNLRFINQNGRRLGTQNVIWYDMMWQTK